MSGNLASPCHSSTTVFATVCTNSGKTHTNQEVCKGLRNKTEVGIKLALFIATNMA
jgi:hypothetical protein